MHPICHPFAKTKTKPKHVHHVITNAQMTTNGDSEIDLAALSERLDSINRVVRNTAAQTKEQPVAESKSDKGDSNDSNTIATAIKEDNNAASSDNTESKSPAIDELTLDDPPVDEDRNKR